jgi:hypothetical protein
MVRKIAPFDGTLGNFQANIALGLIPGLRGINKFGANASFAQGVQETIWTGGATWVPPTQARIHQVKSTVATDTAAGTGARTVTLYGIDDWSETEATETVTLNGTTNVPTTRAWYSIHRMVVTTHGTASANAGVITATADTDATITARIEIGEGQSQMAVYCFGARDKVLVHDYFASMGRSATAAADVKMYLVDDPRNAPAVKILKHQIGLDTGGSTHAGHKFDPPLVIQGPGCLVLEAIASANGASISGGFDLVIKETQE